MSEKLLAQLEKATAEANKQLLALREELDSIDDEMRWLESAPTPLEDALAAIDNFIQQHDSSAQVRPFFLNYKSQGLAPMETELNISNHRIGEASFASGKVDLASVLIPLLGAVDAKKRLHALAIKEAKNIDSGPPLIERPALIAALQDRHYMIEVEEEALICQAEGLGIDGIYRRHNCNPEIVLMTEEHESC